MSLFQLPKKISRLFKLSWHEFIMLSEVFILTGIFRMAILIVGFKKITKIFCKYREESTEQINDTEMAKIKKIMWAVSIVSKHTPWESKCLVKALTAQRILAKYKISSTLFLGVAKDKENKLIAHAWLKTGSEIVTGNEDLGMFTEVARFSNSGGKRYKAIGYLEHKD